MQTILSNLRTSLPELRGALVTTIDGLPVAQSFNSGPDGNCIAAMAATALGLGQRIDETLGSGRLAEFSVR